MGRGKALPWLFGELSSGMFLITDVFRMSPNLFPHSDFHFIAFYIFYFFLKSAPDVLLRLNQTTELMSKQLCVNAGVRTRVTKCLSKPYVAVFIC